MNAEVIASVVNSVGLLSDIAGAWLLFKYGLPKEVVRQGTALLVLGSENDPIGETYDRRATWAIRLLIAGFALQLISDWVPMIF